MGSTRQFGAITWDGCLDSGTEADFAAIESRLDVHSPPIVRMFLVACQGGRPVERSLFRNREPPVVISGRLDHVLALSSREPGSMAATRDRWATEELLPSRVVPRIGRSMLGFGWEAR